MQIRIFNILILIILLLTIYTSISFGQDIVVNRDNLMETITIHELQDIYFGKKNFWTSEGSLIKISPVYNHGNIKKDFLKMLSISETDFQRHWYKLIYSGKADPPKGVQEDTDVIKYVLGNKGAIGFVTPGNVSERVKVIRVIP